MSQAGKARESKQSSRDRIAAERLAQAEAQARRDRLVRIGIVVLVVVVVIAVGLAVILSRRTTVSTSPSSRPAGVQADGGVAIGTATKPIVDLWEDFQCPVCKAFEDTIGPTVEQAVKDGKIRLVYHPLSFLDQNLNNDSSSRAANAAGCAQDQAKYQAFHDQVYKSQPTTEGAGYPDATLISFGQAIGIPDQAKFASCVQSHSFKAWVDEVAVSGQTAQITATPTFKVDGKAIQFGPDQNTWKGTFLRSIGQG